MRPAATECARHPGREAYISCQRCSRPICPDCQIPAAVGFQCPDCVKGAARTRREATTVLGGRLTDGRPVLTIGLVGLAAVLMLLGMSPVGGRALDLLVFTPRSGSFQPWRYLTYSVAGGGAFVPIMSLVATFLLGRELEPRFGRARLAASWVVVALGGSVLLGLVAAPNAVLYGTAGPTLGLAVAWLVLNRANVNGAGLPWFAWVLLLLSFFNAPWAALLGCALTGTAVGAILLAGRGERRSGVHWGGLAALAVVLVLAIATISLV